MRISDWSSDVCSSDLYRAADEDELLLVARLAAHNGFTAVAVNAARRAARGGAALIELGYPLLQAAPARPPEPALVHAIIRQESAFDAEAVSRAGARGLMQLMQTGRAPCRERECEKV